MSRSLLKTMLHLLLFTTLLKLAAIRKERDLSLALVLSGMLFVASVSTSFHYAILLYVLLVAFVGWTVLVKWALWRDLTAAPEEWSRDRAVRDLPGRGPLFTSVLSTVLMSVNYVVWVLAGQFVLAYKLRLFPIWGFESAAYVVLPVLIGVVSGLGMTLHADVTVETTTPGDATHNEVQQVHVNNATAGTYTLSFSGSPTAAIAYNASAADVKSKLQAVSGITSVNVSLASRCRTVNFVPAINPISTAESGSSLSLNTTIAF